MERRIKERMLSCDETKINRATYMRGVRAPNAEARPWLDGLPVAHSLLQYHMAHVGILEARHLTRIVRIRQTTTFFLACYGGKGRVLIDGRWRRCEKGSACLLPAHALNAFETVARSRWDLCAVCYRRVPGQTLLGGATVPVMAQYQVEPLRLAVMGLIEECSDGGQPALIQRWTELIHGYVQQFAQSSNHSDQLSSLWDRVAANPAEEWSLAKLARESGYSGTHLHRLCLRQLGRSPMRQVIYLRMRRAAELLISTAQTIEAIANQVGYKNPFVFSNTFAKWNGSRPSKYRLTVPAKDR